MQLRMTEARCVQAPATLALQARMLAPWATQQSEALHLPIQDSAVPMSL